MAAYTMMSHQILCMVIGKSNCYFLAQLFLYIAISILTTTLVQQSLILTFFLEELKMHYLA